MFANAALILFAYIKIKGYICKRNYNDMSKPIKEQPAWCSYPEADRPFWGCWSLLDGYVTGEDFCKKCDCYKGSKK